MDGWVDAADWSMFSQPSALFVLSSSISVNDDVASIHRSIRHPFSVATVTDAAPADATASAGGGGAATAADASIRSAFLLG